MCKAIHFCVETDHNSYLYAMDRLPIELNRMIVPRPPPALSPRITTSTADKMLDDIVAALNLTRVNRQLHEFFADAAKYIPHIWQLAKYSSFRELRNVLVRVCNHAEIVHHLEVLLRTYDLRARFKENLNRALQLVYPDYLQVCKMLYNDTVAGPLAFHPDSKYRDLDNRTPDYLIELGKIRLYYPPPSLQISTGAPPFVFTGKLLAGHKIKAGVCKVVAYHDQLTAEHITTLREIGVRPITGEFLVRVIAHERDDLIAAAQLNPSSAAHRIINEVRRTQLSPTLTVSERIIARRLDVVFAIRNAIEIYQKLRRGIVI
jgi:hypothetical protein